MVAAGGDRRTIKDGKRRARGATALLYLIGSTGEPKVPTGLIQKICFRPNSPRNAGALAGKTGWMQATKARLWSKYLGCMLGSALGDAIGELAFRFPEEDRPGLPGQRGGHAGALFGAYLA